MQGSDWERAGQAATTISTPLLGNETMNVVKKEFAVHFLFFDSILHKGERERQNISDATW